MAKKPPPQKPGKPAKKQAAQPAPTFQDDESGGGRGRFILFNAVPSWAVSMVVHAIILLLLAIFSMAPEVVVIANTVVVNEPDLQEELEEFDLEEIVEVDVQAFEDVVAVETVNQPLAVEEIVQTDEFLSNDIDVAPAPVELSDFGEKTAPKTDLLTSITGAVGGTGVEGRGSAEMRGNMVKKYGGTDASEKAVAQALRWLAEHQIQDQSAGPLFGSWNFDHRAGKCRGRCTHEGTAARAPAAATAMALLPFFGAGQTHMEGAYKKEVEAGLGFLVRSQKQDGGFNEPDGNMYGHGLVAIALCEAYAMTHDKRLLVPAQGALDFIAKAQDPVGGGWRYQPRQAGDTSVVGWQLMALKSGHMGYLQVHPNVIAGAVRFLDTVSADNGAFYGYATPGKGSATTAVGLLCRMYLGWDKQNPSLQKGVDFISKAGPNLGPNANMYYNYYATQVMRHYGGEHWDKWNVKMRDFLVEQQSQTSHMTGSWSFGGGHVPERGGRLYNTSMATMILEVYYRHLPIYGKAAAEEDFPL